MVSLHPVNNLTPENSVQSSDINSSELAQSSNVSERNSSHKKNNKRTKTEPKILDGKFFAIKIREGDKVKAICTFCGKIVSGSLTGTGNFSRHINDKHAERAQDMYNHLANRSIVNVGQNGKVTQARFGASPVISNTQVYFWFILNDFVELIEIRIIFR